MAGEVTKSLEVHSTDPFDEDASGGAVDVDLGSEGRWFGTSGCGGHQHGGSWQEGVGLHDDAEATPSLLVAYSFWESQCVDVTPAHEGSP